MASGDEAAAFAIGVACCLVLVWLHRRFEDWLFGTGVLAGQSGADPTGHFVNISRGRVHYQFHARTPDAWDAAHDMPARAAAMQDGSGGEPAPRPTGALADLEARFLEVDANPLETGDRSRVDGVPPQRKGTALEYGSVDGPLVVIVHGFAGSSDAFCNDTRSGYVAWLNFHGFHVLVPDLHGAGHSDGPDTEYSSELFVEQLAELCLVFGITEPFHLLGFSMGGSVALQFAYRFPHLVKTLVLQAPHIVEARLRLSLQVALRIPFFREALSASIIPFIGECRHNPAAVRACFRLLLTRLRGGGRWSSRGEGGSTKSVLRHLNRDGRTVNFLWGEADSVVEWSQAKKAANLAPASKFTSCKGADHMDFADGPEHMKRFFRSALLAYIKEP